jgi:chromosome segregation ATPase
LGFLSSFKKKRNQVQKKDLEMQVQQQKTKLVLNQNQELEFQHVSEVLEMEHGKIQLRGSCQDETNNIESDEKKITALESKLADLQSSYEFSDSLVSDLTKKERATNDEIEEAHKVAVMV